MAKARKTKSQPLSRATSRWRWRSISRSYGGATFTIGLGDDDDPDRSDALLREARLIDSDVHAEPTGMGWGGDSGAVALVLDAVEQFGGVGGGVVLLWSTVKFTCRRVERLWGHLRKQGITPDMSVGAVGYLCLADLHDEIGPRFDGVTLVHAGELMPEAGAALGHSGAGELFFYLFADGDSSWIYLANSKGQLLHRSDGGPLPWSFYWPTGTDWNTDVAEPPFLAAGSDTDDNAAGKSDRTDGTGSGAQ